ncbi:MAG: RNA polymerase sigma factor [Myxococcota bacterium]
MTHTLHVLRPGPQDEQVLVERLHQGEPDAFRALHERYFGRVFGVARQILRSESAAEDAAQDVFVRVFKSIRRFRGDSSLATWIHRITVNHCLSERTRAARHLLGRNEPEIENAPAPSSALEDKVWLREVLELFEHLSEDKRIAFYLHHVEGLSAHEIAVVMGGTRDAALKRLQRTRCELFALWQRRVRRGSSEKAK